jgi:UDP-glucose:(heptosyl)LPS alpha-1,3-glucosyltransferase
MFQNSWSQRTQQPLILPILTILLPILHADPARGGAERYTIDLAVGLRKRGHVAHIAASTFGQGIQTSGGVLIDAGGSTRHNRYLRYLDQLDRHLASHHYDIVHAMLPVRRCDVYHPHAGIAAAALAGGHLKYEGALMQAVSRVATRLNRRRQRFGEVERMLLTGEHAPVVLCLSKYVQAAVRQYYRLPDSRMAILFNAVDLSKFDPAREPDVRNQERQRLGIEDDQIIALMIANDFERKGLPEAIAAIGKAADPRLVLVVAGKQNPRPYRAIAAKIDNARVTFAGTVADPFPLYRAADFFLLPTHHDPCSLVLLEALAMGLPAISTIFNGACEIMTDGREGFVVRDPNDAVTIAHMIRQMLDADRRALMSEAALALRPQLAYDRHLNALEEIYHRVIHT